MQDSRTVFVRWTETEALKIILQLLCIACLFLAAPAYGQETEDAPHSALRTPHSGTKAVLLSLAVPGLGEAYLGAWGRARIGFAAEAAAWATFFSFRTYSNWRETDYRLFAADHAGVTLNGQPESYFRDVGLFLDSDDFNRDQLLVNRSQAVLHTGADAWNWESVESREAYLALRRSSRRADNRSYYALGFAFAARVVSMIDTRRVFNAGRHRIEESGPSLNLITPPDGSVWLLARVPF